jgi:hypothetical protein
VLRLDDGRYVEMCAAGGNRSVPARRLFREPGMEPVELLDLGMRAPLLVTLPRLTPIGTRHRPEAALAMEAAGGFAGHGFPMDEAAFLRQLDGLLEKLFGQQAVIPDAGFKETRRLQAKAGNSAHKANFRHNPPAPLDFIPSLQHRRDSGGRQMTRSEIRSDGWAIMASIFLPERRMRVSLSPIK